MISMTMSPWPNFCESNADACDDSEPGSTPPAGRQGLAHRDAEDRGADHDANGHGKDAARRGDGETSDRVQHVRATPVRARWARGRPARRF